MVPRTHEPTLKSNPAKAEPLNFCECFKIKKLGLDLNPIQKKLRYLPVIVGIFAIFRKIYAITAV